MPAELWWLWLIMAVTFIVIELATAGFFVIWFGLAALLAMGANLLGGSIVVQWVVFLVFSTIGASFSRKFAKMVTKKEPDRLASEEVLNYTGKVVDELEKDDESVLGKFKGETWRCIPEDDKVVLIKGDKLKVLRIEGTHLVVEKIPTEEE